MRLAISQAAVLTLLDTIASVANDDVPSSLRLRAEAVAAVARLPELDRATVRRRFEERFTARRMAEDYLSVYRTLAGEDRSVLRAIR